MSAQLHDELAIYDFEWRKLFIFARTLTLNFGKLLGSGESNVYQFNFRKVDTRTKTEKDVIFILY